MTAELLNRFFIPVFLAVGFSMKLWGSRGSTDRSVRYYWLTIFSIVILIAADALESWAQRDPDLVLFRTAFTVIGYVMRPVAARLYHRFLFACSIFILGGIWLCQGAAGAYGGMGLLLLHLLCGMDHREKVPEEGPYRGTVHPVPLCGGMYCSGRH